MTNYECNYLLLINLTLSFISPSSFSRQERIAELTKITHLIYLPSLVEIVDFNALFVQVEHAPVPIPDRVVGFHVGQAGDRHREWLTERVLVSSGLPLRLCQLDFKHDRSKNQIPDQTKIDCRMQRGGEGAGHL